MTENGDKTKSKGKKAQETGTKDTELLTAAEMSAQENLVESLSEGQLKKMFTVFESRIKKFIEERLVLLEKAILDKLKDKLEDQLEDFGDKIKVNLDEVTKFSPMERFDEMEKIPMDIVKNVAYELDERFERLYKLNNDRWNNNESHFHIMEKKLSESINSNCDKFSSVVSKVEQLRNENSHATHFPPLNIIHPGSSSRWSGERSATASSSAASSSAAMDSMSSCSLSGTAPSSMPSGSMIKAAGAPPIAVQQPVRKIQGTKTSMIVKSVPRKAACFVTRLNKETKDTDLIQILTDAGIKDVEAKLIEPKNGAKFSTAAFRVACDPDCADMLFDESVWPEGVEVREWIFRSNYIR